MTKKRPGERLAELRKLMQERWFGNKTRDTQADCTKVVESVEKTWKDILHEPVAPENVASLPGAATTRARMRTLAKRLLRALQDVRENEGGVTRFGIKNDEATLVKVLQDMQKNPDHYNDPRSVKTVAIAYLRFVPDKPEDSSDGGNSNDFGDWI